MNDKKYVVKIASLEQTKKLGLALACLAQAGECICLDGDLGAGKTTLTQSIALGLELGEDTYVTSPSFAILHEYHEGRIPLYHMDLYRLGGEDDIIDLGFEEYFHGDGLCVIEWPQRGGELIPQESLWLFIRLLSNDEREITIRCLETSPWQQRIENLLDLF